MICKLYVSPLTPSPNWKYTGIYGRISYGSTLQVRDMSGELVFEHEIIKCSQLAKQFYAFATMEFLVGISFEVTENPDDLFKDTLSTLTKQKKKPKAKKGIDKSMISGPSGFQHVSHVGYAKGKGLDVNNVPPEWLETFKKAGLTTEQLQDPKTAKFVMKFMQEHTNDTSTSTTPKKRPPPPPPSRRKPPQVPSEENKPSPPQLPQRKSFVEEQISQPSVIANPGPDLPRRSSKESAIETQKETQPIIKKPDPPKKRNLEQKKAPSSPPPVPKNEKSVLNSPPEVIPPPIPKSERSPITSQVPAQISPDVNVENTFIKNNNGVPLPPSGGPPPPPPFSPPPLATSNEIKTSSPKPKQIVPLDRGDLLSEIRKAGPKALKKVEVDETPKKVQSSMAGGGDLASSLAAALMDRNKVLAAETSDEDAQEEEEWSD
eukprot:NODE_4_length_77007_cov_1.156642.p19 type:complete len:432 gc:universal NODE_4_length_77007_cov_1.156642:29759-28464(-)